MTDMITEVLYTAHVVARGGRAGHVRSDDGKLDLTLSPPTDEEPGTGTNPEQLFAAGYAACFQSALAAVAEAENVDTSESVIDAAVRLGTTADEAYAISAELAVAIPGVSLETAQHLVEAAHQVCPYSRATRGNIDVAVRAVPARG